MTIKAGAALIVALVVSGSALSGCGGPPRSEGGPAVAPTSSSGPAPVQRPSGEPQASVPTVDVPLQEGEQQSTGPDRLPEGFPAEEVPIVAGKVLGGSRGKAGGPYTLRVRVPEKDLAEVLAAITAQLSGKGFAALPGFSAPGASAATFRSSRYDVGINLIRDNGRTTVTYVVLATS